MAQSSQIGCGAELLTPRCTDPSLLSTGDSRGALTSTKSNTRKRVRMRRTRAKRRKRTMRRRKMTVRRRLERWSEDKAEEDDDDMEEVQKRNHRRPIHCSQESC